MPASTSMFVNISSEVHKNGKGREITLTSGQHFYDGLNGHVIVLDQDNEMGFVLRPSVSQYAKKDCRYEVVTFPYMDLSFLSSFQDEEGLKNTIKYLSDSGIILPADADTIFDTITKPIKDMR